MRSPAISFSAVLDTLQRKYSEKRRRSQELYETACQFLPGGDSRSILHYAPYPSYMKEGQGCLLTDIDGHHYLDFLNNYTSLVLGHCHPRVTAAVKEQVTRACAFAAPNEHQVALAERICKRVSSIEKVRFCNSGTEATLHAMRAARIFSGRRKIIKMDGSYHGSLQPVDLEGLLLRKEGKLIHPDIDVDEKDSVPSPIDEMVSVPVNDKEKARRTMERYRDQVAAIIVEPMLGSGGSIPAAAEYLHGLRDLADEYGCLLIFDEVQTFRFGPGGFQGEVGVRPDITCLGKLIGGGFPIGAFGGSDEVMALFSPQQSVYVSHNGTFNANPVSMIAGGCTLEVYDHEQAARLERLGNRLFEGLRAALETSGVKVQVTGRHSIFSIHPHPEPVEGHADVQKCDRTLRACIHLLFLEAGISIAPRGMFNLSTAMGEHEIDRFVAAFEHVLAEIRPVLAVCRPDMLVD
jgi:glutamate-1-semialdehyde 2,1-aminomutase